MSCTALSNILHRICMCQQKYVEQANALRSTMQTSLMPDLRACAIAAAYSRPLFQHKIVLSGTLGNTQTAALTGLGKTPTRVATLLLNYSTLDIFTLSYSKACRMNELEHFLAHTCL